MIYIPKICGTCNGSSKALELVYEIYEREIKKEKPKNIYIYKEILHNKVVINELNALGIKTINSLENITSEDIIIIRAHGEGEEVFKYLEENNIEYYDATCPNVLKIHEKIKEYYQEGYEIIILGKKEHPEVMGSMGWCENNAIIISDQNDIYKISNNSKKFITCQTTFNKEKSQKLIHIIKDTYKNSEIVVYDSFCGAVSAICKSSEEISHKCDVIFVIGDKFSSNSMELFRIVSNITTSYNFGNITDFYEFVKNSDLTSDLSIGITGGASTPKKEIYNYKYLLTFLLFYKRHAKMLRDGQDEFNYSLINNLDNPKINEIITDFLDLNKDGKYIRGTLIALGEYLATKKEELEYLPLAYAYETFQTAVLIHDDIIDNAKYRRNKETIPRRICKRYLDKIKTKDYYNDTLKYANSIGICAGDYGFYEANKVIIDNYQNHKNFASLLSFYNDIIIKTIKGEILDVTLPYLGKYNYAKVSENDILDIYNLKTSWYTIIGPFLLGFILGGGKISNKFVDVLNKIGYAFQIKDDILGIFGESDVIGKSTTSDIEEFKQTIMYSYIMNTEYKNEFLKYYGKKTTKDSLNHIKELLKKSGAYDYALVYLNNIYAENYENIDSLPISEEGKDILKGLMIYINIREK